MDALVVVESVFGNTRRIAEAVAQGMGPRVHARVIDVAEAVGAGGDLVERADVLVVGGPTHAFGMTRPSTRRSAAEQSGAGAEPAEVGLREWLASAAPAGSGRPAAAFDTRMRRPRMPGSAAAGAMRAMRRLGFDRICRPASFWVTGVEGPLVAGELERARLWGSGLVARLSADAAERSAR